MSVADKSVARVKVADVDGFDFANNFQRLVAYLDEVCSDPAGITIDVHITVPGNPDLDTIESILKD